MLAFNFLGKLGRLGNQMFQYAATRGISSIKGYEWCVPKSNPDIDIFNTFKLTNCQSKNIYMLDQGYAPIVKEKFFHFDEVLFYMCPCDVSLYGYFQSEKYFKGIEDQIRNDFIFLDEIRDSCEEAISNIERPISLHIRRGDYLNKNEIYYNLELDYYENALNKFDSNRNVIIFSDDVEWCKNQDIFSNDRFLISDNLDKKIDMCLMSLCSDFIIANSTFSWWGAWLANRGKVIAPKKWFKSEYEVKNQTKDLYLENWELI